MKLSLLGAKFIANFEGFSPTVYKDIVGKPTIGYGHLIKEGEEFDSITKEEATDLLKQDADVACEAIDRLVTVDLEQNEFDALVSFTYNLGVHNFETSTLLKLLNEGNKEAAADEFPKWDRAGGEVVKGILLRRKAERDLFLYSNYGDLV